MQAASTQDLLDGLSWGLRLKIWAVNQTVDIVTESPTSIPTIPPVGLVGGRRVGIQSLVRRRSDSTVGPSETDTGDENKMRLKLFRLMYETVRDSDLKVKRAELIQKNYDKYASFRVGMFMGDLQDKYTVMTDIASTLKRFHSVWKPIEHINAYEQIANAGIEISQLIEHLRAAAKKSDKDRDTTPAPPIPPQPAPRRY